MCSLDTRQGLHRWHVIYFNVPSPFRTVIKVFIYCICLCRCFYRDDLPHDRGGGWLRGGGRRRRWRRWRRRRRGGWGRSSTAFYGFSPSQWLWVPRDELGEVGRSETHQTSCGLSMSRGKSTSMSIWSSRGSDISCCCGKCIAGCPGTLIMTSSGIAGVPTGGVIACNSLLSVLSSVGATSRALNSTCCMFNSWSKSCKGSSLWPLCVVDAAEDDVSLREMLRRST